MNINKDILDCFAAKASFDYITFSLPSSPKILFYLRQIMKGRVESPRKRPYDWITIHDVQPSDFQNLVEMFPRHGIIGLETTIDFFLKDGSNDSERLAMLHQYMIHACHPQHKWLVDSNRYYYVIAKNTVIKDTLNSRAASTTAYWRNKTGFVSNRLYIKTDDNKKPIKRHSVRYEATFNRGGCQDAQLHTIVLLPDFICRMRDEMSHLFFVADGFSHGLPRVRSKNPEKLEKAETNAEKKLKSSERNWVKYGAAWGVRHGYKLRPNAKANLMIGNALKSLRERYMSVELPENVADVYKEAKEYIALYQ